MEKYTKELPCLSATALAQLINHIPAHGIPVISVVFLAFPVIIAIPTLSVPYFSSGHSGYLYAHLYSHLLTSVKQFTTCG